MRRNSTVGLTRYDTAVVAAIVVLGSVMLLRYVAGRTLVAEDAAILFRYGENVAHGHGIVWNPGEHPVDGATDLLFMLVLAGFVKLGVAVETAAKLVNSLCFLAVPTILYLFARRRGSGYATSLVLALFIMLGPAITYARVGFGAPTFGLSICVAAMLAVLVADGARPAAAWAFGGSVLVSGLVRPEGFLIGGILLVVVFGVAGRAALPGVVRAAAVVIVGGLCFLAWRWSYFGYPFPNPYYRKGGGTLHSDGLKTAVKFAVFQCAPLLGVPLVGLAFPPVRRRSLALLVGIGLSVAMWALLSDEANFNNRFEYPTMIVGAVFAAALLPDLVEAASAQGARLAGWQVSSLLVPVVACSVLVCSVVTFALQDGGSEVGQMQLRVASVMRDFSGPGRTVVTTEAGYVGWKSGWRSIDAWGLNDEQIAHDGFLTEREVAAIAPDVLFVHVPTSPRAKSVDGAADSFIPGWTDMTTPLVRFAESAGYTLAVAMSDDGGRSSFVIYVKDVNPRSASLVADMRAAFSAAKPPVILRRNGRRAIDLAHGDSHLPVNSA